MNNSKSVLPPMGIAALLLCASNCLAQDWVPVQPAAAQPTATAGPAPALQPVPQPASSAVKEPWLPEFLNRLPQPPDRPASLYEPALAQPYSGASTAPRPYFEVDPLLDPPNMPGVGWFYSLDMQAAAPHVYKLIDASETVGSRPTNDLQLQNRGLAWTIAPRIELGYNLPSGFGGIALSYRFLGTSGNAQVVGPDGLAPLHSRMDLNVADLDYVTREFTPNGAGDRWTMRWRAGLRFANVFYDSTLNQSLASAAPGTGILQQHVFNQLIGAGPHVTLELTHQLGIPGLSLLEQLDFASIFGGLNQGASETALDPASPTGVSFGRSGVATSQTAPVVNLRLGLDWQPPRWNVHAFAGYQYEYWWNVGRFSIDPASRGDLSIQGFVLQLRFNY